MHIGGCLGACDVGCLWCCIRVWPGRRRPKHENGNPTGKVMQDLFKGGLKRVISYGWGLPFVMLFLFICCLLKKKKTEFYHFFGKLLCWQYYCINLNIFGYIQLWSINSSKTVSWGKCTLISVIYSWILMLFWWLMCMLVIETSQ